VNRNDISNSLKLQYLKQKVAITDANFEPLHRGHFNFSINL
jgi:hypothetical protein